MDNYNLKDNLEQQESLEERFSRERLEWSEKIAEISLKLKNIVAIAELMTTLYTERQRAVEYYHYIISLLNGLNKIYNKSYAEKYDYYTTKSQIKYPNETTKVNKIHVDLADIIEKRQALDNHSKFISSTIQTLDNIIFAIPRRVEIEQILRGK